MTNTNNTTTAPLSITDLGVALQILENNGDHRQAVALFDHYRQVTSIPAVKLEKMLKADRVAIDAILLRHYMDIRHELKPDEITDIEDAIVIEALSMQKIRQTYEKGHRV